MQNLYVSCRFNFIYALLLSIAPCYGLFAQPRDSALFKDDFDRTFLGSFWDAKASWSIVSGSAFNFIDGTGGSLRTTAGYSQNSYIIETTAKGFTPSYYREFRITFGQADLLSHQLYQVKYTAYGGGKVTLSKSTDNLYFPQVLDEAAVFPNLNASQWYTFKIAKYKSGLIQVYLDEGSGYGSIPILETIDFTYPELGHTGWQIDTQTFGETFYVDWIAASKPGMEKPPIKEKPAEDSLITQVTAKSGIPYEVDKLVSGVKQFVDRDHMITVVPPYLNGASFIRTANDDKSNNANDFLTFFVKSPSIIYVGYDPRSTTLPEWLSQWTKTSDRIESSDAKLPYLEVYSKSVEYGEIYPYPVIIGGNLASPALGTKSNYLVAAVRRPNNYSLQAEDALISGADVANEHLHYFGTGYVDFKHRSGDYIEWTAKIDVPGIYNLAIRFSHGGFDNRTLKITNNKINVGTVDFQPTFSWDSWATLSGPNVFLSAGTHKIRISATGDSGPNIDELSLSFLSPVKPGILSGNSLAQYQVSAPSPDLQYKAFPNPFIQNTRIYYSLNKKAHVTLSIYTLLGQRLQVIENSEREAGSYQATFNAGKLPKGIYIFKLQIGNLLKTGKLIKE